MATFQTISPVDGSVYVERELADLDALSAVLDKAKAAQKSWRATPLQERMAICTRFVEAFEARSDELSQELSWQMGRPIKFAPFEIAGTCDRARQMIAQAEQGLHDVETPKKPGFNRYIKREPLGTVLVVPAWNYPYLISINSVVPALLAGNAVVLKPSAQTPLCGERFAEAFKEAGLPDGLYTNIHLTHELTAKAVADPRVDFVAFTGSVGGGHAMVEAAKERFIGVGLELGGKDPAYVRADADLPFTVENLVDGALFNSGQSCCGIERIYVHESVYDDFVSAYVAEAKSYAKLGDPTDESTTLGPLARASGAAFVRKHIADAVAAGAKAHLDAADYPANKEGTPYLAPQVLTHVDHSMDVMMEETFGPVVGIMKVKDDEQAIALMNDSPFGLTASVWTEDEDAAVRIGAQVETGTFFQNRCDALDPQLAWVGVKDSGRGCTLSVVGYEHLTRPKSFHLRTSAKNG